MALVALELGWPVTGLDVKGLMIYEDGNGREHARQAVPCTDFPLQQIRLYACWDTEHWVIMLPSEY